MSQSEAPREAVEAVERRLEHAGARQPHARAHLILIGLRNLLPTARWRLIAWLAEGLEPTEAMRVNGGLALEKAMFEEDGTLIFEAASACCTAMLAAAREADNAG